MRVAVVGAGIVGRLLSWQLSQHHCDVTIFDEGDALAKQSCSHVAAGMLAPLAELERGEALIYELGMHSLALWQQWLPQFETPILFKQLGTLVISHPQDVEQLSHYVASIQRKSQEHAIQYLSATQLSQLEPDIGNNMQAILLAEEGQIGSQDILQGLYQKLQHPNVTWKLNTKITKVQPFTVFMENQPQQFNWVFDCRGLGAKADLTGLRGVRGELLMLRCPEINIQRPVRLLHPRYQVYLVPRAEHHYIVGATEIDSEDFSPISVRSTLELLGALYLINSGFAEARILASHVHCRPAFSDNQPKIFSQSGLTAINGLFRNGYLLAPALISSVIDVIINQKTSGIPIWQKQH